MTLSLCMIVKNEEYFLEKCIKSVKDIADEIIVVDTGSTDKTIDIAKNLGAKVYKFKWVDDFAKARNFGIKKAKSDWILILDADESLHPEDIEQLRNLINSTTSGGIALKILNFVNEISEDIYNTHISFRIFKNGKYEYKGSIHEQLVPIKQKDTTDYIISEIRVKHYGYIKEYAGEKKRERNIPMIQKILDKDPNNGFHLFNMGNEYMCKEEYKKAIEYFQKSFQYKDINSAYTPHLFFRLAYCLDLEHQSEQALRILDEGLKLYPQCGDYEFLKAMILKRLRRYTLAVESFNKCLTMEKTPANLKFIQDAAQEFADFELSEIYYNLDDFANAIKYQLNALSKNPKRYDIIYKIGKSLHKALENKDEVSKQLEHLFADSNYTPNIIVMIDVLLNEKLYEQAVIYLNKIDPATDYKLDFNYLKGRAFYYCHDYEKAFDYFMQAQIVKSDGILANAKERILEYLTICSLLINEGNKRIKETLDLIENSDQKNVLLAFLKQSERPIPSFMRYKTSRMLNEILIIHNFELFEKCLYVLNLIDSNEVLIDLAEIYYNNGIFDLSVTTIMRSVKELDAITPKGVEILSKIIN